MLGTSHQEGLTEVYGVIPIQYIWGTVSLTEHRLFHPFILRIAPDPGSDPAGRGPITIDLMHERRGILGDGVSNGTCGHSE